MVFIPIYILILGFTIVIDYFAGILIEKTEGATKKKLLILSLVTNIGVLSFFKYYNFLNHNLSVLIHSIGYQSPIPHLDILLPLGLSFHTFQAMSYNIEVYRGKQKAERHFGIYALYVMFYPQLVAGPIERPQNLIHQFYEKHEFDYDRIVEGLKLMLWGFFMKLVIADRLAIYVNAVFDNTWQHSGKTYALAIFFFSFQIYCDFAGYSNIAIGAAKVMGFKLMTNFNRPYFSRTISEFWRRWHISLSSWFRDYLYKSLGANRISVTRWYLNLLFVFIIVGLWHGANWTYIVFGALNGFYIIFAIVTSKWRKKLNKLVFLDRFPKLNNVLQIVVTYLLVCFAGIFFRANSVIDSFHIAKNVLLFSGDLFVDKSTLSYSFTALAILLLIEFKEEYYLHSPLPFKTNHWLQEHLAYSVLIILILVLGVFDGGQVIYFQF